MFSPKLSGWSVTSVEVCLSAWWNAAFDALSRVANKEFSNFLKGFQELGGGVPVF